MRVFVCSGRPLPEDADKETPEPGVKVSCVIGAIEDRAELTVSAYLSKEELMWTHSHGLPQHFVPVDGVASRSHHF